MASQVQQVFYVEDPHEGGCHYVMKRVPDDIFDSLKNDESNANWMEPQDFEFGAFASDIEEDLVWTREDLPGIEMPLNDASIDGIALHSDFDIEE
ncbi:hypothetical protein Dimus_017634, partial [Dionaea muscipula]